MTPDLFNRARRASIRARALRMTPQYINLSKRNGEDLIERLSWVRTPFTNALILGDRDSALANMLSAQGMRSTHFDLANSGGTSVILGEEDRLPFGEQSFDLVIANGLLDSVNDLPGALLLIRRCLTPGGLFLGAMSGAGTLAGMRQLFAEAMARGEIGARQHIHPQIEIRSAGDLLVRAGFALPVVDQDEVTMRFPSFGSLISDLRANGLSNALHDIHPFTRAEYQTLCEAFEAGDRVETFNTIFLTGWTAQAGDPKPQTGPKDKMRIA
jgi:NADH dehydrogenase [ubiquinone] 1 alpha subcomplex assembly factor 5